MSECVDPIVGKILAGWRYDISGIAPEMRADYEEHFDACERCRSRQRLHRTRHASRRQLVAEVRRLRPEASPGVRCPESRRGDSNP